MFNICYCNLVFLHRCNHAIKIAWQLINVITFYLDFISYINLK